LIGSDAESFPVACSILGIWHFDGDELNGLVRLRRARCPSWRGGPYASSRGDELLGLEDALLALVQEASLRVLDGAAE
jgi:hypothetical protein